MRGETPENIARTIIRCQIEDLRDLGEEPGVEYFSDATGNLRYKEVASGRIISEEEALKIIYLSNDSRKH